VKTRLCETLKTRYPVSDSEGMFSLFVYNIQGKFPDETPQQNELTKIIQEECLLSFTLLNTKVIHSRRDWCP
jgi:hypothetical protein